MRNGLNGRALAVDPHGCAGDPSIGSITAARILDPLNLDGRSADVTTLGVCMNL